MLMRTVRKPQIRGRAYQLWEEAGRPTGRDVDFWLVARFSQIEG
jgi:hypothetical protein